MLTNNYRIDLMLPSQANKDVIFNEAVIKLDSFCNIMVEGFISNIPTEINLGKIYILSEGEYKNNICYCPSEASGWKIQSPKISMIFYVKEMHNFLYFDGNEWVPVENDSKSFKDAGASRAMDELQISPKTIGITGVFDLPPNESKFWLYLSGNTKINLNTTNLNSIILIIKQNYQNTHNLEFVGNILWQNKEPMKISQVPNVFDVIRFHKIAETDHWIPEIVGQKFSY